MIHIRHDFTLSNFVMFDLDTATGITNFEEMLNHIKIKLYSRIPVELNKAGYKEDENYIVELKKVYWDNNKIENEIYKYYADSKYLIKNKYIDRKQFYELIDKNKPFDLELVIKTENERFEEKFFQEHKGMVKINIPKNFKGE